jgi:flagellar basal body-associated protein FliL
MANEIMNNEVVEATENTAKAGSKKKLWTILGIGVAAAATAAIAGTIFKKKKRARTEDADECDSDDCELADEDESVD